MGAFSCRDMGAFCVATWVHYDVVQHLYLLLIVGTAHLLIYVFFLIILGKHERCNLLILIFFLMNFKNRILPSITLSSLGYNVNRIIFLIIASENVKNLELAPEQGMSASICFMNPGGSYGFSYDRRCSRCNR